MSFEYALNAEREMALGMIREIVADNSKLMERNAELREENAKLREQGARLFDKTLELGTENDKLRELVAIFRSKEDRHPCINAQCLKCNDAELCEREAELVRELGIEVEE